MTEDDAEQYTERADFLERDRLYDWTIDHRHFDKIQRKIVQSGAKLLVGPRGSGKTHHFRYAHTRCREDVACPFSIYVSFTRYYYLEPYLRKSRDAAHIFHSWVLAKILLSILTDNPSFFEEHANEYALPSRFEIEKFITRAERGYDPTRLRAEGHDLSPQQVVFCIEAAASWNSRRRSILLLDDAALVLTPEYMTEFFDIFRSLKSARISPKASVYPGTTEYGPRFHADHDAEKVQAWLDVNDAEYSRFMERIARDRLDLSDNYLQYDVLTLIGYAAFGIPRAFITMCRHFVQAEGGSTQQRVNSVIRAHVDFRKNEYLSLADKITQYRDIIQVGWHLFDAIVDQAADETKSSLPEAKATHIGLLQDADRKRERMIRFLVEAGLLYELPPVSHGRERDYARFVPHYAFLIDRRAFSVGRGWSPKKINLAVETRERKHPIRRQIDSLLDATTIARIELNLPPCRQCGTERISPHQSYCHICGGKLVEPSIFQECMGIPIDQLPITRKKKDRIKSQTSIQTIGDIIHSDDPASELRKARSVGEVWAERIYDLAKSVEEEFFS